MSARKIFIFCKKNEEKEENVFPVGLNEMGFAIEK
jgi:hypothetical protein